MKRLGSVALLVLACMPAQARADDDLQKASPEQRQRLQSATERIDALKRIYPVMAQIGETETALRRQQAILLQAPNNIERGDLEVDALGSSYGSCIAERGAASASLRAALASYAGAIEDNRRALGTTGSGRVVDEQWKRSFETRMQREQDVGQKAEALAVGAQACKALYGKLDSAMKALRQEVNGLRESAATFSTLAGQLRVQKARLDRESDPAVKAGWFAPVAAPALATGVSAPAHRMADEAGRLAPLVAPSPADASVLEMAPRLDGLLEKVDDATRAADADAYLHLLPAPQAPCTADCYDLAGERAQQRAQADLAIASLRQSSGGLAQDDGAALAVGAAATADRARIRDVRSKLLPAIAEDKPYVDDVSKGAASWNTALNAQYNLSMRAASEERTAALRDIYGVLPVEANMVSAVAPPLPMAMAGGIVRHVYQLVQSFDMEAPAKARTPADTFGSYTYVFLRGAAPFEEDRRALGRYQQLFALLCAEPEGVTVPAGFRKDSNLFVLAGQAGACAQAGKVPVPYQGDLGNQWKLRAQAILANKRMREILANSSGPFLLTLPTRINGVAPDTPALFADLSGYEPAAIKVLVDQYKNGLMERFPTERAQWQPTASLKVALTMISLANNAGDLAFKLFPANEARAAP